MYVSHDLFWENTQHFKKQGRSLCDANLKRHCDALINSPSWQCLTPSKLTANPKVG